MALPEKLIRLAVNFEKMSPVTGQAGCSKYSQIDSQIELTVGHSYLV
jgi:hypothetical protein